MITADKVFKGSTPISKIYQGLNLVWEMAAPIPGADAYVQNGLVFQLDGIEKGDSPTAWTDLKGGLAFTYNNCTLNSDNVEFNGVDSYAESTAGYALNKDESCTVEYCFYSEGGSVFNSGLVSGVSNTYFDYVDIKGDTNFAGIVRDINYVYSAPMEGQIHTMSYAYNSYLERPLICDGEAYPRPNSSLDSSLYQDLCKYGNAVVGCYNSSATEKSGFLKGKVFAIRIYNRTLTREEQAQNQQLDYLRFKIPCDKITINLSNDREEPITGATIKINGMIYTQDQATATYCVPKGWTNFIWFNGVPYNRAPEAMFEIKGTQTINAKYTYTGFEDGLMFEAVTGSTDQTVEIPSIKNMSTSLTVDWGDNTVNSSGSHTYANSGTYIIKASGGFKSTWYMTDPSYSIEEISRLTKILQWPSKPMGKSSGLERWQGGLNYVAPAIFADGYLTVGACETWAGSKSLVANKAGYGMVIESGWNRNSRDMFREVECIGNLDGIFYTSLNLDYYIYNDHTESNKMYIKYYVPNVYSSQLMEGSNVWLFMFSTIWSNSNPSTDIVLDPRMFTTQTGQNLVYNFSKNLPKWGTGSAEAKQALVKTLTENTPDMTLVPGTHNRTIQLSADSKAVLTEDEIAQITSKGYTIA